MQKNILNQKTPKLWVLNSKTAFMQRIADYVRTGHKWYVLGQIDPEKLFRFWDKMTATHPVFDDKMKAYRARKAGEATGRLMFYQGENDEKITWILLVHGERQQLDNSENWRDATGQDRVQLTSYELVRMTKQEREKPVWTWRYSSARYQEMRDKMVHSIRSGHVEDVKFFIKSLWGTAGFGGSREQAKALHKLLLDEWKRRNGDTPPPEMPANFGYTRRKKDAGIWMQRERKKTNIALAAKQAKIHENKKLLAVIDSFPQVDLSNIPDFGAL